MICNTTLLFFIGISALAPIQIEVEELNTSESMSQIVWGQRSDEHGRSPESAQQEPTHRPPSQVRLQWEDTTLLIAVQSFIASSLKVNLGKKAFGLLCLQKGKSFHNITICFTYQ